MSGVGKVSGNSGQAKGPQFGKIGHLGSHTVIQTSGRLLQSDINVDTKTSDNGHFTADRTVADGNLTQKTDHLSRTFFFGSNQ